MKIERYTEFINESLNLDWEEIRHILDDMGSGEFTQDISKYYTWARETHGLPLGFYVCGYINQIQDPSEEDIETAKDRLEDIGLTLVSLDIPSTSSDGIKFLLVETDLLNNLKSSGYKFLDDLDWKDWHMNKVFQDTRIFRQYTGVNDIPEKVIDTKHSRQKIGDSEISIVWGPMGPFEDEGLDQYEFYDGDDTYKIYSKVQAECFNIHLQQRERGSQEVFKKLRSFESFSQEEKSLGRVLILHGYEATASDCFYPWLKEELENIGYEVELPELPSPFNPKIADQVKYIQENYPLQKDIIIAHSLGGCVALKYLEQSEMKTKSLYLLSSFLNFNFYKGDEDIENLKHVFSWKFDFHNIKSKVEDIFVLYPSTDTSVTFKQASEMADAFNTEVITMECSDDHFCGEQEPQILNFIKNKEGLNEEA